MIAAHEHISLPGLKIKFLAGLMLVSAALFLGLLADLPHIPIMVCLGWLMALGLRKPLKISDRSVTYSILLAILVATLLGYFYPLERGRLGFFSFFFRPEYYCAFALNLALVSCFFQSSSLIAASSISAIVFVLGTCGDVNDLTYLNVRFIWGSHWINNYYASAYAFMVGFELLLALAMLKISRPSGQKAKRQLTAKALTLFSLLALAGMVALVFHLHEVYKKEIHNLEQSFIAAGGHSLMRHFSRRVEPFFGDDVDLNRPFPFGDLDRERRIMLRVSAAAPPGYLRSRVFCHYNDGRWSLQRNYESLALLPEEPEGILAMVRYRREDRVAKPENSFDIYFSSILHSDQLALPAPFAQIDLIADNLAADIEGQLVPTKWKRNAGYVVYGEANWRPGLAFDLPIADTSMERYLQVPDKLAPELKKISGEIPGLLENLPDAARCAALIFYLQQNFTYSLGDFREPKLLFRKDESSRSGSLRRRLYHQQQREQLAFRRTLQAAPEEPLLHFLQSSHSGHCELFASAAALLLRQNGIAARYVTGFLCVEPHPNGEYYVSRLGHAHAWIEAFDRQENKWILLDPTPPDGIRDYADSWTFTESLQDQLRLMLDQLLAAVQRGLIATAVLSFLKLLWHLFWNPIGVPLSLLLVAWGLHYWRKQRKAELISLTKKQKILAADFKKLARRWEKRLRLEKTGSRTARELFEAARHNENVATDELTELQERIDNYEKARFQI